MTDENVPMLQLLREGGHWIVDAGAYLSSEDRVMRSDVSMLRQKKIVFEGKLVDAFVDETEEHPAQSAWIERTV